jgi:ABC-type transporter Mla MlaB component
MEIVVSQEQGRVPVTVFHITGQIDGSTAGDLDRQARQAYEQGTRALLLDLKDVPYMSSAGLRALNSIFTLLRGQVSPEEEQAVGAAIRAGTYKASPLKLLNPSKKVLEVLKMMGYDMFLDIHTNSKEAIASF